MTRTSTTFLPAPRPGRAWVWYMVSLGVLAVTFAGIQVWYNLSLQLKPEQVAAARALWQQKGPRSYDLEYTQEGDNPGTFVSQVRNRRVVSLTRNGQPLEPRLYKTYDMPTRFPY